MSNHTRPTYPRLVGDVLIVLLAFAVIAGVMLRPRTNASHPVAPVVKSSGPAHDSPVKVALTPTPTPKRQPKPLDQDAIDRANAELDAASRDRALADHRAAEASDRLKAAEIEAAQVQMEVQTLSERVRDPRARLASVQQRGELLQAEVKSIEAERVALADVPRPRRKALVDKSPVAKPTNGNEYHFEVRKGRVSYIDMDKLIDKVKTDARIQIRLGGGGVRSHIASQVGPVGPFVMRYEMVRSPGDYADSRGVNFDLAGWELIPARENRGETFETIQRPMSEFGRAVNRLSPTSATITLWIYPDSFNLYREVRDYLHRRGFTVAARPLPFGMTIRGSPGGSLSATQ